MNVCIYSDVHWCQNSSIVRSRGEKYSTRLENLIESMNWAERLAWDTGCDAVICCGDFFDASVLNSEEISALKEIKWSPISHLFLTGNHETNVSSLEYSTTDLFSLCPNSYVVNKPEQYFIGNTSVEFCFIPYVLERDRKTITEYFGVSTCPRVIFSHNDLKNVQYGSFLSTEGFELSDIEANCNLYFNGHIHHCCNVTSKVINIGNLTGQNFTEDALTYSHCAIVLNTETLEYKFYNNPYALKFYKLDATTCKTEQSIEAILSNVHYNGVLTLQVQPDMAVIAKELLENMKKDHIVDYRLIVKHDVKSDIEATSTIQSADHLQQFETYVLNNIGTSDVVKDELQHILR